MIRKASQELAEQFTDFMTHDLRKTKLKEMAREDKKDLAYVQKYAGHSSVNTTMKYVEVEDDELLDEIRQTRKEKREK